MSMRCGSAALELLDAAAFAHLDTLGERVRRSIDKAFLRAGGPGRATGLGSLLPIHFRAGPVNDYRSARPSAAEEARLERLMVLLLNDGVIMANNGLMALSTPMTTADADTIVAAVGRALVAIGGG
jgi:glutamate-1-semialdehyde 2,1-aminomutase